MEPWDVDQRTTHRSCVNAVRMVAVVRPEYPSDMSDTSAIVAVASRPGSGQRRRCVNGSARPRWMPGSGPG
jgi:hypothetical protein